MKSENNSYKLFLSKNIRFLREGLELSQEELADNIGVGRDNVTSYERGTNPKLHTLLRLSRVFAISIEDLSELNLHSYMAFSYPNGFPLLTGKEGTSTFFLQKDIAQERLEDETENRLQPINITEWVERIKNLTRVDRYFHINREWPTEISCNIFKRSEFGLEDLRTQEHYEQNNITFPSYENSNVHPKCPPICLPNSKIAKLGRHIIDDVDHVIPMLDITSACTASGEYLFPDHIQSQMEVPTKTIDGISFEVMDSIQLPAFLFKAQMTLCAFEVANKNMTPTLDTGDIIVTHKTNPSELKSNVIYAIVTKRDGVFVKRAETYLAGESAVKFISDNESFISYQIPIVEILGLFEVVCKISLNLNNDTRTINEKVEKLEQKLVQIEAKLSSK